MTDTVCAHPRAFIFDCDGTLVRSMGMWIELGPQVLADYGVSVTGDDLARFESLSMYGECCAYHDTWGVGNDGDEIYDHMMGLLLERYRTVVPARDGVKDFLESVKAAGIPMCIATSTPAHAVRCGLSANGLDGYFDVIVTTQDAGASKDHPDVYDLALDRLCAHEGIAVPDRGDVWVFEDALFGLKSSGSVGYRRVGVYDYEGRSAREDVRANCEIFVDEFTELDLDRILSYCRAGKDEARG